MEYQRAYTDDRVRHRHHKHHSRDTKNEQSGYHDSRSRYVPGSAIKGNEREREMKGERETTQDG